MKFSAALASSIMLANTALACVRVYVDNKDGSNGLHQEVYVWDQDKVSRLHLDYNSNNGNPFFRRDGYTVQLNGYGGGRVTYPNGNCTSLAPRVG
jgi:hypothetical protein